MPSSISLISSAVLWRPLRTGLVSGAMRKYMYVGYESSTCARSGASDPSVREASLPAKQLPSYFRSNACLKRVWGSSRLAPILTSRLIVPKAVPISSIIPKPGIAIVRRTVDCSMVTLLQVQFKKDQRILQYTLILLYQLLYIVSSSAFDSLVFCLGSDALYTCKHPIAIMESRLQIWLECTASRHVIVSTKKLAEVSYRFSFAA